MLSKNAIAIIVYGIETVLTLLGIEFEHGSVAAAVEAALLVGAFILSVWHQLERYDSEKFIFKI